MASRFATVEEVFSTAFWNINENLIEINKKYQLADHLELNKQRFEWAEKIDKQPIYYASRMWEYPFAILSAELEDGMKCADIGCGTTPFTAYIANKVGPTNVVGFDPDYLKDDITPTHSAFGVRKSFVEKVGFKYQEDDMCSINYPNESFDRVFCISVIEHIEDKMIWGKGLKEMIRILKPNGRLILTVDLGINIPLTNPLEIIQVSGLAPMGGIDLRWPEKRFVNLNGTGMDVYGLVLEKSTKQIYLDNNCTEKISEYMAFKKFIPETLSKNSLQIAKDFDGSLGTLKVLTKLLLRRYFSNSNRSLK